MTYAQENSFISSTVHTAFSSQTRFALSNVTLSALHGVFWMVLVLFAAAFIINLTDPQKKVIR